MSILRIFVVKNYFFGVDVGEFYYDFSDKIMLETLQSHTSAD